MSKKDLDLRIRPDKVGSVCLPFDLGPYVTVHQHPIAEEGAAVVCRVLTARKEYGHLELTDGRHARLVPGDLIIGVLGSRAALRGFCGRTPTELKAGDRLSLLNMGGVIGVGEGDHAGLGSPIELEVIGTPIRRGRGLRLKEYAVEPLPLPAKVPPILALVGTCMHAGKTTAAARITRYLRERGMVVHAGKATGVAAYQDLLMYSDNGARKTLSFLECGLPSTAWHEDVPDVVRVLIAHLAQEAPDCIVLEFGDGLMGAYGVDSCFEDPELGPLFSHVVLAANDVIGAAAGVARIQQYGASVRVVTGPATDNAAGSGRLESEGIPAANILLDQDKVCRLSTQGIVPEEHP